MSCAHYRPPLHFVAAAVLSVFADVAVAQSPTQSVVPPTAQSATQATLSPQFDWDATRQRVLGGASGGQRARAGIIVGLATFNALNTITPRYSSYGAALPIVADAAPAAAIAAAYQTVLSVTPGVDAVQLDRAYQDELKKVPDGSAKVKGIALGRRAALAMLAMRAEDDLSRVELTKREPAAGVYELTPDQKTVSSFFIARMRPYGIASTAAYDPGPPLAPDSVAAKRDILEVKSLGARNSTTRTADQSVAAIFWNSGDENDQGIFKAIAEKRRLSALDTARMLALADIGEYDARIVYDTFKDKYVYWRPYNAIRGRFADPAVKDDKWEPLLRNPPNPDYPSGSGVAGGVMARHIEIFNGGPDTVPLVMNNSAIGVKRSWSDGEAMGRELGYARIWGGVHFRQSVEVGHKLGRRMMDEMSASIMVPLTKP